jgi:hypothetical protein
VSVLTSQLPSLCWPPYVSIMLRSTPLGSSPVCDYSSTTLEWTEETCSHQCHVPELVREPNLKGVEVNRLKKGCNERYDVWYYTRGKQGICCTEISSVMPARPSSKRKLMARWDGWGKWGWFKRDLKKNRKILFRSILFDIRRKITFFLRLPGFDS